MSVQIRVVEHLLISMPDGTRLAARLWLPASPEPVPALLDYTPYRKREGTRARDEAMHGWFAEEGYAVLRVDIRGTGDSEGFLDDEFLPVEQEDACRVIAWIAEQPWCDGKVGMIGKSWGGFSALQVAARRPPALKAIIAVDASDDRYADGVHVKGGALPAANLSWGTAMMVWQSLPPTPSLYGDGWREAWRERVAHLPFFPALWAEHQRQDAYWRQGSVRENYAAIEVPVFAVSGWADAYSSAVPRLMAGLSGPRLGLIGPWAHLYPHEGLPGPAIGFLQEAKRWWDHWLKNIDTGIMAEPLIRAYMQDPAMGDNEMMAGRWIGEASWPSRLITKRPMFLTPGQLWWRPAPDADLSVRSPLWCGLTSGQMISSGLPGEGPLDQRIDDGSSLVFDSKELADRTEIFGAPEVVLELASDSPSGQICVRLCDISPDGSSRRVSWAILNLSHRHSHADPTPPIPGQFEILRIRLDDCAHAFPAGHRIRLAISTGSWPAVWPAADVATLTIRTGESAVILPVRRPRREDAAIAFQQPVTTPTGPIIELAEPKSERRASFDLIGGTAHLVVEGDAFGIPPTRFEAIDTDFTHKVRRHFSIQDGQPDSARQELRHTCRLACDGHVFQVEVLSTMTSRPDAFVLSATVAVYEDEKLFAERGFSETIARDLV